LRDPGRGGEQQGGERELCGSAVHVSDLHDGTVRGACHGRSPVR
jgi:hypothetical protein